MSQSREVVTKSPQILRPASEVMTLARMGSSFAHRLSFMRVLLRTIYNKKWQISQVKFSIDDNGYGYAIYRIDTGDKILSQVIFSQYLEADKRSDRVIASAWDFTFTIYDGIPNADEIDRLRQNVPLQEAGRFQATELLLSRANKSVRLFNYLKDCLSNGNQPDITKINKVGYLARTTAVYGNGKFGIADRHIVAAIDGLEAPFQIELLSVYIIREFTIDLIHHIAKQCNPKKFKPMCNELKVLFGIGNSTGLGMAPFMVNHPELIHQWVLMRECALSEVLAIKVAPQQTIDSFITYLHKVNQHINEWQIDDLVEMQKIQQLQAHFKQFINWIEQQKILSTTQNFLWQTIYQHSNHYCIGVSELVVSLLLEVNPAQVNCFGNAMSIKDVTEFNPAMPIAKLKSIMDTGYSWVFNSSTKTTTEIFWYYSADKQEPRIGEIGIDDGVEKQMPFDIVKQITDLKSELQNQNNDLKVWEFLLLKPRFRNVISRMQCTHCHQYAEIHNNLVTSDMRPIDILRFKLAFFGATKFDPKSDKWLRITMYQGAPLIADINAENFDNWSFYNCQSSGAVV